MNDKPHSHELRICHDSSSSSKKGVRIEYGDQTFWLYPFFWRHPSKRRILRASARIIKRHDTQSVKSGQRQRDWEDIKTIQHSVNKKVLYKHMVEDAYGYNRMEVKSIDAWASEVLAKKD